MAINAAEALPTAEPDEKTTPSRTAILVERYLSATRSVLSRAPLSVTLAAIYVVVGFSTGTAWRSVTTKSWFENVGYGVPAVSDGRYWTFASGMFFGLTPWQFVSIVVLLLTACAWAESRLGTWTTAVILVAGQLIGIGSALVFAWGLSDDVIGGIGWDWPTRLAAVDDVGMTTAIVGIAAAATATLTSPWRLRLRLVLAVYVAVALMFDGTLADVSHLVSFAVMLLVGERLLSRHERGFAPRSRREVRLLGFAGLVAIGVADVVMWVFRQSGPLSPTDADGTASWIRWIEILIIALLAWQLRIGKRWAWWVTVVVGVVNVVGLIAVIVAVAVAGFESVGGVALSTSLLWLALTLVLVTGRFAFCVPFRAGAGGSGELDRMKGLLHEYGGGTMSWMATWEGNSYQFLSADGVDTGYVAYQRHAGVLIALTDPVCAPTEKEAAVQAFTRSAESSGLVPCWFSVSEETASSARDAGWRAVKIAEDAIVDLPGLAFKGKSWQGVRTALNKARKEGISHRLVRLADETVEIRTQVSGISDEWVGGKGLPEMGFTLGGVDEAMDEEVYVSLAVNAAGDVLGVLSWLPVYGGGSVVKGWTLDVMRRAGDEFGPVIEFLLGSAMLEFQSQGAEFVSLSGAPLASDDDSGSASTTERALSLLGAAMEPFYGFRSLHAFKKKFRPRYEPVYLAYRDEGDLARIGIAISRAYLPNATPAQLGRMILNSKG